MKHPTPHPGKKRCAQWFIPEDAWSIIASFLPIKEQFSVLYTSKRIQQITLNSVLKDTKNSTILFRKSVSHGHHVITQFLLRHDLFDPSARDNKNHTAIQIASYYGCTEVVRLLLNGNCVDPSYDDNYAIRLASRSGHVEVVQLLLSDNRVDPSDDDNEAICFASYFGHVEVVRLLLSDNRVDPSSRDNDAIRCASHYGHVEVVRLLLSDNRVDPSARDNYAIKRASQYGHVEVVRLLLNDIRVTNLFLFMVTQEGKIFCFLNLH
jgi:ankyrin repeat protein